ncbi:hypothetical protein ACLK1S_14495 [Escherichia coli]
MLPAIAGALYPLLSKHDEALDRFFSNAFTFARGFTTNYPLNLIMTGAASRSRAAVEKPPLKSHELFVNGFTRRTGCSR